MKKLILLLIVLGFSTVTFTQPATFKDVLTNNKGTYTQYTSQTNEVFKTGDTLTLGKPIRLMNYSFINALVMGADIPLSIQATGRKVTIKRFEIWNKQLIVYTEKPAQLRIYRFEEAVEQGEIKSNTISSADALQQLKTAKDKLDLEIITPAEYNLIKTNLIQYIK